MKENCLGELQIRILLAEVLPRPEAANAAQGWGGDVYRVYERGPDRLLVWATTWDNLPEAVEAEKALLARYRPATVAAATRWSDGSGHVATVVRRGTDLWYLSGVPEAALGQVTAWAQDLERSEKRFTYVRATPKRRFPAEPDPSLARTTPPQGAPIPTEPLGVRPMLDVLGLGDTALVEKGEAFAERACACEELPCIDQVVSENDAWYATVRQGQLNPMDFERLERAAKRLLSCVQSVTDKVVRQGAAP